MNRRAFLKSIATVCGAVIVCPGELLKSEPAVGIDCRKSVIWCGVGKRRNHIYIEGKHYILNNKPMPFTYQGVPIHYQENLPA